MVDNHLAPLFLRLSRCSGDKFILCIIERVLRQAFQASNSINSDRQPENPIIPRT